MARGAGKETIMPPEWTEYYQFDSASGPVVFETRVASGAGPVGGGGAGAFHRTGVAIEALLGQIRDIVRPLKEGLEAEVKNASEIGIEFGVKVGGKAGLIVAATEVEGNIKVSLKWQRTNPPKTGD